MKERIKEFFIFLNYIVRRPFQELFKILSFINKPDTWIVVLFLIFVTKYMTGQGGLFDKIIVGLMVIVVMWKEWLKGEWKHEWRQKKVENMRKKIKEAKKE